MWEAPRHLSPQAAWLRREGGWWRRARLLWGMQHPKLFLWLWVCAQGLCSGQAFQSLLCGGDVGGQVGEEPDIMWCLPSFCRNANPLVTLRCWHTGISPAPVKDGLCPTVSPYILIIKNHYAFHSKYKRPLERNWSQLSLGSPVPTGSHQWTTSSQAFARHRGMWEGQSSPHLSRLFFQPSFLFLCINQFLFGHKQLLIQCICLFLSLKHLRGAVT